MTQWRWIDDNLINAIHDRQLAEHAGPEGIRDAGAIESALARPKNLVAYEEADAAALAAAYCYGIIKNRGFVDGNKRTGWIVTRLFLLDNGFRLTFNAAEAVLVVEEVAAGTLAEANLAQWLRERVTPIEK